MFYEIWGILESLSSIRYLYAWIESQAAKLPGVIRSRSKSGRVDHWLKIMPLTHYWGVAQICAKSFKLYRILDRIYFNSEARFAIVAHEVFGCYELKRYGGIIVFYAVQTGQQLALYNALHIRYQNELSKTDIDLRNLVAQFDRHEHTFSQKLLLSRLAYKKQ